MTEPQSIDDIKRQLLDLAATHAPPPAIEICANPLLGEFDERGERFGYLIEVPMPAVWDSSGEPKRIRRIVTHPNNLEWARSRFGS